MLGLLAEVTTNYTYTFTTNEPPKGLIEAIWTFIILYMLFIFVVAVFFIVCMWKIFEKAGVEGWKSIIPIYNTWKLNEIAGKPG